MDLSSQNLYYKKHLKKNPSARKNLIPDGGIGLYNVTRSTGTVNYINEYVEFYLVN